MFAFVAAVLFGFALLFDLAKVGLGDIVTTSTLLEAGLFCLAVHMAGYGTNTRRPTWNWRRAVRRR